MIDFLQSVWTVVTVLFGFALGVGLVGVVVGAAIVLIWLLDKLDDWWKYGRRHR